MTVHVVGFGLAGAWCCYWLHRMGVPVVLHDVYDSESSTRIAAGMIAPITGQRVKPTWKFPELWALAQDAYPAAVFQRRRLRRVHTSERMLDWFMKRLQEGEYDGIGVTFLERGTHDGVAYPYGGFETPDCATVNLPQWLEYITTSCGIVPSAGPVPDPDAHHVVIHAMGHVLHAHPLWQWLPLEPSKGEILDVTGIPFPADYVLSNGTWIIPVEGGRYRVGATNDWDDSSPLPTAPARTRLLASAMAMVPGASAMAQPDVVAHRAAIRPSTRWKRPLVGPHPEYPGLYVCTGFGAKGTLYGPWAAQQLVSHIVNATAIDDDIAIRTYWK